MGIAYEQDMVWRAQELYCVDRLTYKKISEITGVSLPTLRAWSQKFRWAEKREELSFIESEIRVDILRSRKKVLDMLLDSDSGKECSQMAYAVNALENLAMKQQKSKILSIQNEQENMIDSTKDILEQNNTIPVNLTNKEEVIEKLGTAIQYRISCALQNPQTINSKVVDDIVKMLHCFSNLKAGVLSQEKIPTQTNVIISTKS